GGGIGDGSGGGFNLPPKAYTDGPEKILAIVDDKLNEATEAPAPRAHVELARILRDLRPDAVLAALPPARQEELRALPREQMAVDHYNPHQFRRMLDLLKELIKTNKADLANQLADHYFNIFNDPEHIGPDELSRIPELFKVVSGIHAEFWNRAAELLSAQLLR